MIYEIIMSRGPSIKIDEEDLQKIKANLSANLIQVKQAIINPSFMEMIVPTDEPDTITKPKYEIEGGTAKVIGEEKINALADKMNPNKLLAN